MALDSPDNLVALFTGAWIEMVEVSSLSMIALGRALYGRVD